MFVSFLDARQKIEAWRIDYMDSNENGSLGNMTAREFTRQEGKIGLRTANFQVSEVKVGNVNSTKAY